MSCWDVLQLAPTTDRRAIKLAYAVLLKQNKPDENPAGFQQLHAAYQQALAWDGGQVEAAAAPLPAPAPAPTPLPAPTLQPVTPPAAVDVDHEPVNDTEQSSAPAGEDEQWELFLDQQWDLLVDRIEALLDQPEQRNQPQAWDFLTHSEALLDIEFKAAFSLRFLQRLVNLYRHQSQTGQSMLLPDTVQHLNRTFWWDQRRHHFEQYIEASDLDDFMAWWQPVPSEPAMAGVTQTSPPRPLIPYGNYYVRWVALLLDLGALFAMGYCVNLVGGYMDNNLLFAVACAVLGYAVASPLFEVTRLQGTPGKYLCGLKVCDNQGQPIGIWRAVLRCAIFLVSMRLLFITVVINLLIWDGRVLHDRLSGSMVLKRQP